jgi:hypothetical protein
MNQDSSFLIISGNGKLSLGNCVAALHLGIFILLPD